MIEMDSALRERLANCDALIVHQIISTSELAIGLEGPLTYQLSSEDMQALGVVLETQKRGFSQKLSRYFFRTAGKLRLTLRGADQTPICDFILPVGGMYREMELKTPQGELVARFTEQASTGKTTEVTSGSGKPILKTDSSLMEPHLGTHTL